jgi:hypothetical protein
MREVGFEPAQALSYCHLKAARLTTPALPLDYIARGLFLKISQKENYL